MKRPYSFRSIMLLMAFLVMLIISIYQYSWSLFAFALTRELKWDLATIPSLLSSLFSSLRFFPTLSR